MKKPGLRAIVFLSIMIVWLLIDEYVKEGYLFDPKDLLNGNITHEKVIVALAITLTYLTINKLKKR